MNNPARPAGVPFKLTQRCRSRSTDMVFIALYYQTNPVRENKTLQALQTADLSRHIYRARIGARWHGAC